MKSRDHKKIQRAAQTPPESDEQRLRNVLTVSLDDEDEPKYQAVDEFSDEFLLQVPSTRR